MRIIVIGAGGTGRELLLRLGELWEVVIVDVDAARLEEASSVRPVSSIAGDGSSSVVLARAGLEGAAALVAATSDDDTNLEAIRIAKAAGLLRVVGVAADPERIEEYRALEVPAFAPHRLAARNVELALEPRRVASSAFARGKAEAIEVELSPDAPVVGKRLRDLHSRTWVVAAVLRSDVLVVPHGDTVLQAGDRVTVVGAAADYAAIVATFTAGVTTFPLAFGKKVAVATGPGADVPGHVAEAIAMVRATRAESLTVVHPESGADDAGGEGSVADLASLIESEAEGVDVEFRAVAEPLDEGLRAVARGESVGLVVVPGPDPTGRFTRLRIARIINAHADAGSIPLLLSRARLPYEDVVVPARRSPAGESAVRVAIDLARETGLTLTGVSAVAPAFVATRTDTEEAAREAMAWLREEAAVHGVSVTDSVRQGNPVRVISDLVTPSSLLVMGSPRPPVRALSLGITGLVAARVTSSVLLIPGHG